jgi:Flp pilus assembly protein TadG
MRNRIRHLRRDERGMALAFVGLSFMAFMAATTLAIDVGMFMTARGQAQNAADAGALAGATALGLNSYTDRSSSGPAVQSAINAATANNMMGAPPSVLPGDVTFPANPTTGQTNRVMVSVYRTVARSNAIPTLIGGLFGVPTVDIGATATAEAAPANAMTCVKPFMIPDKWTDVSPNGTFNIGTDKYVDASDPVNYTGYTAARDVGSTLVLRAGTGDQLNPSFYFSWKMPGDIGGNFYRNNIDTCNQTVIGWSATDPYYMIQEPGDKSGPTLQGIKDLIAADPDTYWDTGCKCVKGSVFSGQSPRVFPIPLFNPEYYAEGKANGRGASFELANFLGFYADHWDSNGKIYGIITNITGVVDPNAGPAPAAAFPVAIQLVQ